MNYLSNDIDSFFNFENLFLLYRFHSISFTSKEGVTFTTIWEDNQHGSL